MEQLLERVLELKSSDNEPCILKPQLSRILQDLQSCENICTDHRTFQILNTLAIEYKPLIQSDLALLKTIIFLVSSFIKPESNIPQTGKEWSYRVLRWLLVIDPDASDIPELKKCFLMAVPSRKLYLTHLEIGLEELIEKILFYISVKDENLLIISLEGFSEYFKIDPILMESIILTSTHKILEQLIRSDLFFKLPDNFISNLMLESSSHYYNSLDKKFKLELCKLFIDVFEFEILNSCSSWFIEWLSKDLNQFKKFCQYSKEKPELLIFLDRLQEEIVEMGRLKGFHSKLSYDNCKKDLSH